MNIEQLLQLLDGRFRLLKYRARTKTWEARLQGVKSIADGKTVYTKNTIATGKTPQEALENLLKELN